MQASRDESGIWTVTTNSKNIDPNYIETTQECLNCLDPLFIKAKQVNEFDYIITLLRVFGLEDAGWDPLKNLEEVFDVFNRMKNDKKEYYRTTHFSLFLYGLITEASEPYEIIANLINVASGDRARACNFPDKINQTTGKSLPQHPKEKIEQLKSKAKKIKIKLPFFDNMIDSSLRNSIFHSDYSLYGDEIRIKKPTYKSYSKAEKLKLINQAIAYYETFMKLYYMHIAEYKESNEVEIHPAFGHYPDKKAVTIVRKNYGLIGIKDNLSKEEIKNGLIPFQIGNFRPKELGLIKNGQFILPRNRTKTINNFLRKLPYFISVRLSKILQEKNI